MPTEPLNEDLVSSIDIVLDDEAILFPSNVIQNLHKFAECIPSTVFKGVYKHANKYIPIMRLMVPGDIVAQEAPEDPKRLVILLGLYDTPESAAYSRNYAVFHLANFKQDANRSMAVFMNAIVWTPDIVPDFQAIHIDVENRISKSSEFFLTYCNRRREDLHINQSNQEATRASSSSSSEAQSPRGRGIKTRGGNIQRAHPQSVGNVGRSRNTESPLEVGSDRNTPDSMSLTFSPSMAQIFSFSPFGAPGSPPLPSSSQLIASRRLSTTSNDSLAQALDLVINDDFSTMTEFLNYSSHFMLNRSPREQRARLSQNPPPASSSSFAAGRTGKPAAAGRSGKPAAAGKRELPQTNPDTRKRHRPSG